MPSCRSAVWSLKGRRKNNHGAPTRCSKTAKAIASLFHPTEQATAHCSRAVGQLQRRVVRATTFEFEKRFWIFCAIYFAGFSLSAFDHVSFIAALRHLIVPSV